MFEIIELSTESINDIKSLENSNLYVCGKATINSLLKYENFPIKNKRLAILNILRFIQYIDFSIDEKTTINIPVEKFRSVFSSSKYRAYIDIMSELEILTRVPYQDGKYYDYTDTKRSCQYRVHNRYLKDRPCLIISPKKKQVVLVTDNAYPVKFKNAIRDTKCDLKGAITEELLNRVLSGMTNEVFKCRLAKLFDLTNNKYIKKGKKVDRLYHSFTNLSRISRKYLHVNRSKYHEVDVKNCQPLLLCFLLRKMNRKIDLDYINDCQNGVIYEQFITDKKNRNIVKEHLYKAIYFALKPKHEVAKIFQKLYPLTYQSISELHNSEDSVASLLQNIEASIFNKIRPKQSKYYFTLFDAIYFTDQLDEEDIKSQIKVKFAQYDLTPQFKEKNEPPVT